MESLVSLMRCESKHEAPVIGLIKPQSPSLIMQMSDGRFGRVQFKAQVRPRQACSADKPASKTLKCSRSIIDRHKGPEFYFEDAPI